MIRDEPRLFERVNRWVAEAGGWAEATTVEVLHKGRREATAMLELALDPQRGTPARGVLAHVEAMTGLMGTVEDAWDEHDGRPEALRPLVPFRKWEHLFLDGELPFTETSENNGGEGTHDAHTRTGRQYLQTSFTLIPPPMLTQGVARRRQEIQTLAGASMPIASMFDSEELERVIGPGEMLIERRIALAIGAVYGSNIEYCAAQSVLQPSGAKRRVVELVASFTSKTAREAARGLLFGLEQVYELRRGIVME
ncbi:MAG: hypothetical protein AB7G11_05280 [Phycisphaerales bacterium]